MYNVNLPTCGCVSVMEKKRFKGRLISVIGLSIFFARVHSSSVNDIRQPWVSLADGYSPCLTLDLYVLDSLAMGIPS